MVNDLIVETRRRVAEIRPNSVDAVRRCGRPVAAFSAEMQENDRALKAFLLDRMYRHYKLNRMTSKARRLVKDLFQLFIAEPECLPTDWRRRARGTSAVETARVVADYIAGMTDRFAARRAPPPVRRAVTNFMNLFRHFQERIAAEIAALIGEGAATGRSRSRPYRRRAAARRGARRHRLQRGDGAGVGRWPSAARAGCAAGAAPAARSMAWQPWRWPDPGSSICA